MGNVQTLVVGSGVGGLTMALLLARAGKNVTLVEKQPEIGGYLRRFIRKEMYYDTGFHFSGGFQGVLGQMLQILQINDLVTGSPISNTIVLKETGHVIYLPPSCGYDGVCDILCGHFPNEKNGLKNLFAAGRDIWENHSMTDLTNLIPPGFKISRYDTTTVQEYCREQGLSAEAETASCSFATCHGSPPSDAPMSFHADVGYCLYDSLARPHDGGDSIIRAFKREAAKFGITIRTNANLLPFSDPDSSGCCREARFSDGTLIPVDDVFFTIHPRAVSDLLPEKAKTAQFQRRILRMQETTSFFCVYYRVDDSIEVPEGMISCFSKNDLDSILRGTGEYSTGYLIERKKSITGQSGITVTAFRTMPVLTPSASLDHRERLHDPVYQEFKTRITEEITRDLLEIRPELKGHLHVVDTGSPLTCLDYDPPTGSAYGVRCVCGQSRLCGTLPVRNFHFAGQSASVPGIMGTMITSFIVFKNAMGNEAYRRAVTDA